jgi:hypothetical protein
VVSLVVRIAGLVRQRFTVAAGAPVMVGRAPAERGAVALGPYLDENARAWISRKHVALDLRPDGLYAIDTSTNGTILVGPDGRGRLPAAEPRRMGDRDVLELFEGVEVARPERPARRPTTSPARSWPTPRRWRSGCPPTLTSSAAPPRRQARTRRRVAPPADRRFRLEPPAPLVPDVAHDHLDHAGDRDRQQCAEDPGQLDGEQDRHEHHHGFSATVRDRITGCSRWFSNCW